jgi:hypothetical protein
VANPIPEFPPINNIVRDMAEGGPRFPPVKGAINEEPRSHGGFLEIGKNLVFS